MFGYIKLCGKQKTTYEPRNQWDSPIIYKDHNKNVNPVEQIIVGSEKIYIYIEREREREREREGLRKRTWLRFWREADRNIDGCRLRTPFLILRNESCCDYVTCCETKATRNRRILDYFGCGVIQCAPIRVSIWHSFGGF